MPQFSEKPLLLTPCIETAKALLASRLFRLMSSDVSTEGICIWFCIVILCIIV